MNKSNELPQPVTAPPSYLHPLIFIEILISLIFQFITILLLFRVLFYRFATPGKIQSRKMSQCVIIYMFAHVIGSISTLPHHIYFVVFWRPISSSITWPLYDPYILYWTGIFMLNYGFTLPVPVFFLTIERCLALRFPAQYHANKFIQQMISALSVIVTVVWWITVFVFLLLELPLDETKAMYCQSLPCLLLKCHALQPTYMKILLGILNTFCTAYFFYTLRQFRKAHGHVGMVKNRIVIVTALSEILLSVFPYVLTVLLFHITGESLSARIGIVYVPMFAFDVMICSIFYNRIFLRKVTNSVNVMPPNFIRSQEQNVVNQRGSKDT